VDVSYDPVNNVIKFTIVKGTGKVGQNTWDGWTWTMTPVEDVPGSGILSFAGTTDPATDKNGVKQSKNSVLDFSFLQYNTKSQEFSLDSSIYNVYNGVYYKFPIGKVAIVEPPKGAKDGKKAETTSGKSLGFNSQTQVLSITGSTVVGLPDNSDPLLGANVTYPQFTLAGFNAEADDYVFVNQDLVNGLTLSNAKTVFETSEISALYYNVADNLFYGVLFHNTFDSGGSAFVDYLSDVLDPSASIYDQNAVNYVEVLPDGNFDALTQGFQASYDTDAIDFHFLSDGVPELSTWAMTLAGFAGLGLAASCASRRNRNAIVSGA